MPSAFDKKTLFLQAPSETDSCIVLKAADAGQLTPLVLIEDVVTGVRRDATGGSLWVPFERLGVLSAPVSGAGRFVIPYDSTIGLIVATVGVAPAGADIILDLKKNGVSLFTNNAHRPTIVAGQLRGNTTPDIAAALAYDTLSMDIVQVGSGTPGSDLSVTVVVAKS